MSRVFHYSDKSVGRKHILYYEQMKHMKRHDGKRHKLDTYVPKKVKKANKKKKNGKEKKTKYYKMK